MKYLGVDGENYYMTLKVPQLLRLMYEPNMPQFWKQSIKQCLKPFLQALEKMFLINQEFVLAHHFYNNHRKFEFQVYA